MIPEKLKYDKFMCSQCKEYLYLEAYRFEGKNYCFQHLKELVEKAEEANKAEGQKIKI